MNNDLMREYIALEWKLAEAKAIVDRIKKRQSELETILIGQMTNDMTKAINMDGRTVSLRQSVRGWTVKADEAEVIAGLRANGLGAFVKEGFTSHSINSWVGERAKEVEELCREQKRLYTEDAIRAVLPPPLNRLVKVQFEPWLSSVKSGKRSPEAEATEEGGPENAF